MPFARAQVQEADILREEFNHYAYVVSHDLNAPIRAVREFSRLLEDDLGNGMSEDAKLYLTMIVENAQKLQAMMNGLLEFSRLHTREMAHSTVSMQKVFNDCVQGLDYKIKECRAQIECGPLPDVKGDGNHLAMLISCLLDNAIKFVGKDVRPRIKLSATPETDSYHFILEDNGIGIDPKFYKRIFGIFQRLHIDTEYPGIGMGLALVKKIMEQHGGQIWMDKSSLGGNAVHFVFPK